MAAPMTATPAEARQGLKSSSMSNLTLILIKIAYLAVLWLFVLMAVGVISTDLFGQSKRKSRKKKSRPAPRPAQRRSSSSSQGRSQRAPRNEPTVLAVTQGPLTGTTVNLSSQPILIGRAPDSTLVITDDYASGRHARVYTESGRWFVEDLNSTNGTYFGQQKLNRPQPITVGQPIRIGKTVLELRK